MSLSKGVTTVISFGVLVTVIIVLGILMSNLRASQTTTTDPSWIIADTAFNATQNVGTQTKTVGTIVGVFILVIVAVLMLALLIGLLRKFGGNKGGGKRSGGGRGGQPIYVVGQ